MKRNVWNVLFLALVLFGTFALSAACSGGTPTNPSTTPPSSLASILPATSSNVLGDKITFTVTLGGAAVDVNIGNCDSGGAGKLDKGQAMNQIVLTAENVGTFAVKCQVSGITSDPATVTIQGPATIDITAADGLIYVRNQKNIGRPSQIGVPAGGIAVIPFGDPSKKVIACSYSPDPSAALKWDPSTQTAQCTSMLGIPARGAKNIIYVVDSAIVGFVGEGIWFRGQLLPITPCPANVPDGNKCALLQIPVK